MKNLENHEKILNFKAMSDQPLVDAQVVEPTRGTTKFGVGQLSNPTPMWATYLFRAEFILNKVLLFVLSASSLFTPEQVKESLVWIGAVDLAVWTFGRFLGVSKDEFEK